MDDWGTVQTAALTVMLGGYLLGGAVPAILSILWRSRTKPGGSLTGAVKNIGFGLALIAALAGCVLSLSVLISGTTLHVELLPSRHFGPLGFHADGLSALFIGALSLLGTAVALFSLGYATEFFLRRNMVLLVILYNFFVLSMIGVLLADHALLFLFLWECMSLTTYFLITFEHEEHAARRAGFLYIVMTHIGTAFLLVMFLLLYAAAGSFTFEAFRMEGAQLPATAQSVVFLFATIGFGIKAGIIPFHIWLPEAHPAAPSNVSAMMSGVMIKTGIYGMVRVFFDFLGPVIPGWWGVLILAIAVTSSVLGVLYALMEHDLKRLLAFHSIENIGIILMGVGAALLFASWGNKPLAVIALIAGLYHVLNHAIFKGLLFLGAGSVLHATHSRNIEDLGGLIKRMPWTAFFFLVGAVAISGLPPLNGFISEWLTFQALLLGFHIPDLTVKIVIPLTVALLALTGALAAACFVKAFGITFLGLPRSGHAARAGESSFTMLAAMGLLALLCIFLGIAPGLVVSVVNPLASSLLEETSTGHIVMQAGTVLIPRSASASISPAALTGLLVVIAAIPLAGISIFVLKSRSRIAPTWACGLERIDPRMQYTATGFSKPLRIIFSDIFRATHEVGISEEPSPYFRPTITYELKTESVFLKYLYEPVFRSIVSGARIVRRIQTGRIQTYLAYIFVTLILLLLFAR